MILRCAVRSLCAATVVCFALGGAAQAQPQPAAPQPSAATLAAAKELVEMKGAAKAFDPIIDGVIEYHKNFMLSNNPTMGKDLNEVAALLRTEYQSRRADLQQNIVRIYAQHFTEQELKEIITFYQSPVGKKMVAEEPKAIDDTMKMADQWSQKFATEVQLKMRAELKKRGLTPI